MANEKAQKYAGQLISIKRKTTVLSVMDRLSHVDDNTDATYLELLHPASVYRMSILGDIQKGLSVIANIRPEDVELIWMRLKFAEKKLFEQELSRKSSTSAAEDNGTMKSDAFTVTFTMGNLKGKTPGGYLMESADKDAAIKVLHNQYDFLAQNVSKYRANQKVMDAIKNALEYYELGMLDQQASNTAQPTEDESAEVEIYAPPEKTFRKETKELKDGRILTKCYQIQITFIPSNKYPYRVTIKNRYAMIDKNPNTGMETIRSGKEENEKDAKFRAYKMSLSSGEMVSVIKAMEENLHYYKSCVYTGMRTKDQKLQEINRKAWKPQ